MATVKVEYAEYAARVVKTRLNKVNLYLTTKEAITLHKILCNVGGDPLASARVFTDDLSKALAKALKQPAIEEIRSTGAIAFPVGSITDVDRLAEKLAEE